MKQYLNGVILSQEEKLGVDENHRSGLLKKYFDMMVNGKKIYEVRLNDDKRNHIKKGDIYAFGLETDRVKWIKKTVVEKYVFSDFVELCEAIPFKEAGFKSKEEMLETYRGIYPEKKVQQYGVVAFKLK